MPEKPDEPLDPEADAPSDDQGVHAGPVVDPEIIQVLVDGLELQLFGEKPNLTSVEVAERAGVTLEASQKRWRSLGFTAMPTDAVMFTEADVEALRITESLRATGLLVDEDEAALVRAIGRTFARLAEWQISLMARRAMSADDLDLGALFTEMDKVIPQVEAVQAYAWRRHLLNAASRFLISPEYAEESAPMAVGFADIVGYTRQSRSLGTNELTQLVDDFEAESLSIITELRGRLVKTIGDEVMYAADDPADAVEIALQLAERHEQDETFPELRVGVAWGEVVAHWGDVFGPSVNVASRLTSLARPGKVLIDRDLADSVRDNPGYILRRLRRTSVKGYRRLEPWSVRREVSKDKALLEDGAFPGPASQFVHDQAEELRRIIRGIDQPEGDQPAD
ncbi:MAG: adenylate/guanylate cyclase domain-containing protein [Nocardioidaceae bacterium]